MTRHGGRNSGTEGPEPEPEPPPGDEAAAPRPPGDPDLTAPLGLPTAAPGLNDAERLVRLALASLPEPHRRVILLRYKEHRSFDQIAALMDLTPEATQALWYHALRMLARALKCEDEETA